MERVYLCVVMNWSVKLAKSLRKDKTLQRHYFIQVICQLAIALCICTVLISSFLIRGFEKTIEDKIFNFWSHIRISNLGNSVNPIGESPVRIDTKSIDSKNIVKITPVINKGALLKHEENIEGIVLRGIDIGAKQAFDYTRPQELSYLKDSEVPLILSNRTMDKLNLHLGDPLLINIIEGIKHGRHFL